MNAYSGNIEQLFFPSLFHSYLILHRALMILTYFCINIHHAHFSEGDDV